MRRRQYTPEELHRAERCPDCAGEGKIRTPSLNWEHETEVCTTCAGRGYIIGPKDNMKPEDH